MELKIIYGLVVVLLALGLFQLYQSSKVKENLNHWGDLFEEQALEEIWDDWIDRCGYRNATGDAEIVDHPPEEVFEKKIENALKAAKGYKKQATKLQKELDQIRWGNCKCLK